MKELISTIQTLITNAPSIDEKTIIINQLRKAIHDVSPFAKNPVDCVLWVRGDEVSANDYNPNSVAPPEMKLLEVSIVNDGYTQPIVAWKNESIYEVINGFHRNRVGKESSEVQNLIYGFLPLSIVNDERLDRGDRIASTIRHNRARGKHKVESMSDIVVELKNRNWKNARIARELGMDEDEILRLCQITGLSGLFSDQEFSKSWDIEGEVTETDFQELSDDVSTYGELTNEFRVVNSDDPERIFHHYEKWECYKAGFYNTKKDGKKKEEWELEYKNFLKNFQQFSDTLEHVISEWTHSCEHYLTNTAMNRIAWLGQAAACYRLGLPHIFCGGFNLLSIMEQEVANQIALYYLNVWLERRGKPKVSMEDAMSNGRQSDIY